MDCVPLQQPAAEERVMPVRHNARLGMLLQIRLQPFLLLGTGSASAYSRRIAVCIQRHHMPFSQVVAVISCASRSGPFPPICEIRQTSWRTILMISGRRPRTVLKFSPRRVVTLAEFFRRAAIVGEISRHKHRPRNLLNQLRGCGRPRQRGASSDVSRSHQYIGFWLGLPRLRFFRFALRTGSLPLANLRSRLRFGSCRSRHSKNQNQPAGNPVHHPHRATAFSVYTTLQVVIHVPSHRLRQSSTSVSPVLLLQRLTGQSNDCAHRFTCFCRFPRVFLPTVPRVGPSFSPSRR